MVWRDALRYIWASLRKRQEPQQFRVLGFDVLLRPCTTDLKVARDSLGDELEPTISYFSDDYEGIIVDAGGYIGTSALKLARAFPLARVIVLEPNADNYFLLQRNVAGVDNITPVKAALSNQSGPGKLMDRQTGEWGYTIVDTPEDAPELPSFSEVEKISVQDFLQVHSINEIGIFKVDIEGAEAQLFDEAEAWLDRTDLLIIELHEFIVPGVEARFAEITNSRANIKLPGEKHISIRRELAPLASAIA